MCSKLATITELFIKTVVNSKRFDRNLRNIKLVSCNDGVVVSELVVAAEHLNESGTLHGGFIAHMVDTLSTFALLASDQAIGRGLSVDLSVSYMSTVSEGNKLEIESVAKKVGNKVAFLEVQIRNKDNDELIATGITWPDDRPETPVEADGVRERVKYTSAMAGSGAITHRVAHATRRLDKATAKMRAEFGDLSDSE
ncbi:PREDICTED: acyl-coenzyme A thioesterase 13-like [Papilio xuthus]|uniref:Acyl-coenzyme A thioesterase 13 n=1 Tax=Papilio xuthus TaxID=66420 RepID=A0A194PRR8_PAPXU|nr:PREDICTED: acyl-coenzyme A thioesterase 13-like [Papilio xuthus]KPI96141.1 Acyl-coenzyme A thioesterase 13 [Papilio xuthus]